MKTRLLIMAASGCLVLPADVIVYFIPALRFNHAKRFSTLA